MKPQTPPLAVERTEAELRSLKKIQSKLAQLRQYLSEQTHPEIGSELMIWYRYLDALKSISGNTSNDASFVACLMAKAWLISKLPLKPFDVATKPQGAAGLDIDVQTKDGDRIIGEIKTTSPYLGTKFGAQQLTAFRKDFAKLGREVADMKYLFVTDPATFEVVLRSHRSEISGVTVVCLTTGDESAV